MRYQKIKKYDIANGKGIRTTIWFVGCTHHCHGCFNAEVWDFNSGKPFDDNAKAELFSLLQDPHCDGLSVLGGEPLQQGEEMLHLLEEVKEKFPSKNIWLWSGYYMDEMDELEKKIVSLCDFVVDGRFEIEKSKEHHLFRGSSNQTIWEKNDEGFAVSSLNSI